MGDAGCSTGYQSDRQPSDPYSFQLASEGVQTPFVEKVRKWAQLIVVGTVRDILPACWVTADGRRPANPHADQGLLIITPVRVEVERVAKGRYALPDIYLAALGGRIGADCASISGSGPRPAFRFGERYVYFLDPFTGALPDPVASDRQYRYYRPNYSYTVQPNGTLTIGPEYGVMGPPVDDPPRTLTVDEALREIAALLNGPAATPTR